MNYRTNSYGRARNKSKQNQNLKNENHNKIDKRSDQRIVEIFYFSSKLEFIDFTQV